MSGGIEEELVRRPGHGGDGNAKLIEPDVMGGALVGASGVISHAEGAGGDRDESGFDRQTISSRHQAWGRKQTFNAC
jgi:hypothetical protein